MKTKTKRRFADMPGDYAALCRLHLPRPIRDKADYENTLEFTDPFAGFEGKMTRDQEDYFDLLCSLIVAWEEGRVQWPEKNGLELLKFLLEEHEMTGADLSRVLGLSRNLGPMILRGEREITVTHARTLGKHFGLPPGVFI